MKIYNKTLPVPKINHKSAIKGAKGVVGNILGVPSLIGSIESLAKQSLELKNDD